MSFGQNNHYPRLAADIGGTHSRFALQRSMDAELSDIRLYENKDFDSFPAVIATYLATLDCRPRYAALGIAAAISGETITTANIRWPISRHVIQETFQFTRLVILNDFTALALSLPLLSTEEYQQVGPGTARPGHPLALIGPGTGLGVSGLIPTTDGHWIPLQGEGGHTTLPAMDTREADIIRIVRETHPHVSAERLLCGAGLPNLYKAMAVLHGKAAMPYSAREIVQYGLRADCPVCAEVLDMFCAMLGTVAGNLAMILGAQGGLYVGGGIIPLMGAYFARSRFRARFEEKGRLHAFVVEIPTYYITATNPALRGAAAALSL